MGPWFAAGSVVLALISAPPYIISIVKGNTKPERATWFIFMVMGFIALASQILLGGSWSVVFTALDATGSLIVFALSLRYGVGGWTTLDKIALTTAAIGVVIAFVAHDPVVALLGDILADISGTVLTVIKTYRDPDSEVALPWLLIGTSAVFAVLAVGRWDFGLILYPAYLALANYVVVVAQAGGRLYSGRERQ